MSQSLDTKTIARIVNKYKDKDIQMTKGQVSGASNFDMTLEKVGINVK